MTASPSYLIEVPRGQQTQIQLVNAHVVSVLERQVVMGALELLASNIQRKTRPNRARAALP